MRYRMVLLAIGISCGCSLAAIPANAQGFVRGDSNGDDAVDIADAIHTLAYLFSGGPVSECLDAADANDSGSVNIADAITTLDLLFSGSPPLPPPYPTPGTDPTPDALDCASAGACGSGSFTITPPIAYTCAFGLLDITLAGLEIIDLGGGAIMAVPVNGSAGIPNLSGNCAGGVLTAGGVIVGGCDEIYSIELTFDSPTSWTGTFALQFSGPQCGQTNCVDQSWSITGQQ